MQTGILLPVSKLANSVAFTGVAFPFVSPSKVRIEEIKELFENYDPGRKAIATLEENNGSIEASFEKLWQEKNGTATYSRGQLWEVTKKVLRQEICGDEGFRDKVKEYNKNRSGSNDAPLLIGAIVHLVNSIAMPIDPGIATIIVLYILKVGLDIFCEYTDDNIENNQ